MELELKSIGVSNRIRNKIEKIPEMAVSLKTYGQIHAITVRPSTTEELEQFEKPWMLVTGGRRMAAAILIGWETIRADDLDHLSPYKRMAIELEENLQREEMHFSDVVETKARLHELYKSENPTQTMEETASALGESVANVSRDIALAQAIREQPELKQASSKKAAVAAVKMQGHHKALQTQYSQRDKFVQTLKTNVVTADMRDWLRIQETGSIDLLLSDLPYGIDYWDMQMDGDATDLSQFDDSLSSAEDLFVDAIPQMLRATNERGWLVLFTGYETFTSVQQLIESCCVTHYEYESKMPGMEGICVAKESDRSSCKFIKTQPKPWIWYRPNSRNNSIHPDLYAQNQYENILVCNRGGAKLSGLEVSRKGNVLVYDTEYGERVHDHQKPIELLSDLIERFTLRDAMVADCCFGSGTTLAAAAKTSRRFKGCEKNPLMLNIALGMIAQFYKGEK